MKKTFVWFVVAVLLFSSVVCFAGCNIFDSTYVRWEYDGKYDSSPIDVGETLENHCPVLQKDGYKFEGWFDSETGGNMWVDAKGKGVKAVEKRGKNYTLYPHFTPLDFVVQLNAEKGVQGLTEDFYNVKYDSELPEFPSNLTLAHKKFIGYYTEANGNGTQVTRGATFLPNMDRLTHSAYDIDDNVRTLNLYAYFEDILYTVTFHFGNGYADESLYVPYGTPLNTLVYETRDSNGYAMSKWSTSEHGAEYNDSIKGDTDLYAIGEWAPAVELDSNGGKYDYLLVGEAGSELALPTPTKTAAKFVRWLDEDGDVYTAGSFPENSVKLTASWMAMIEFDSNGGTRVENICVETGTPIELPVPTRDGYVFAGWYPENKIGKQYFTDVMPTDGVKLIAGWCKPKFGTVTWMKENETREIYNASDGAYFFSYTEEDLKGGKYYMDMTLDFECLHYGVSGAPFTDSFDNLVMGIFSQKTMNTKYALSEVITFNHEKVKSWKKYQMKAKFFAEDGTFYISMRSMDLDYVEVRNLKATLTYPDLSTFEI